MGISTDGRNIWGRRGVTLGSTPGRDGAIAMSFLESRPVGVGPMCPFANLRLQYQRGGGKASIVETVASAVRDENNDDESDDDDFDESKKAGRNESSATNKKHTIIGCLWASASYTTRGHENAISDTTERLIEWIEFNLMVGMDHIYVYDNTGAHTEETDLSETLARFSSSEVTRINWPARPCNNNVP